MLRHRLSFPRGGEIHSEVLRHGSVVGLANHTILLAREQLLAETAAVGAEGEYQRAHPQSLFLEAPIHHLLNLLSGRRWRPGSRRERGN
jgi:hypothetical protein